MMGTVVSRGVPNQPESASRSASAAVSVGSSMVAAQAMWASGRIRRASAGDYAARLGACHKPPVGSKSEVERSR
jgi:hypothetical protein